MWNDKFSRKVEMTKNNWEENKRGMKIKKCFQLYLTHIPKGT